MEQIRFNKSWGLIIVGLLLAETARFFSLNFNSRGWLSLFWISVFFALLGFSIFVLGARRFFDQTRPGKNLIITGMMWIVFAVLLMRFFENISFLGILVSFIGVAYIVIGFSRRKEILIQQDASGSQKSSFFKKGMTLAYFLLPPLVQSFLPRLLAGGDFQRETRFYIILVIHAIAVSILSAILLKKGVSPGKVLGCLIGYIAILIFWTIFIAGYILALMES